MHQEYLSAAASLKELVTVVGVDGSAVDTLPLQVLSVIGYTQSPALLMVVLIRAQEWYIHAITVLESRALTIQGRRYLVPYADMFNYAPQQVRCSACNLWASVAAVPALRPGCVCRPNGTLTAAATF